jgi:hypothetical protein
MRRLDDAGTVRGPEADARHLLDAVGEGSCGEAVDQR